MEKKNQNIGGQTFTDIRIYHKATIIKWCDAGISNNGIVLRVQKLIYTSTNNSPREWGWGRMLVQFFPTLVVLGPGLQLKMLGAR